MVEHRQVFHRELEAIEAQVIELFGMVAEDLPVATDAVLTGNGEAVRALVERDQGAPSGAAIAPAPSTKRRQV